MMVLNTGVHVGGTNFYYLYRIYYRWDTRCIVENTSIYYNKTTESMLRSLISKVFNLYIKI